MSEQLESASLSKLATRSGTLPQRDQQEKDVRARSAVAQRSGGFDGFMKTFLGNDKTGANGHAAATAQNNHAKTKNAGNSQKHKLDKQETGKMSREERRALREAMDKTVDAEAEAPIDQYDEIGDDMAAAAEEAARLILALLFPDNPETSLPDLPDDGVDAFSFLAEALGRFSGRGAGGAADLGIEGKIDAKALAEALATTNASAEMNADAVLSALGELLDGMPRKALDEALAKLAGQMGLTGSGNRGDTWFSDIAAALDAELVDGNVVPGQASTDQLLAALAGTAEGLVNWDTLVPESGSLDQTAATGEGLAEVVAEVLEKSGETAGQPANVKENSDNSFSETNRQKGVQISAEFSGLAEVETEIYGLFKQFLKEKSGENTSGSPINDQSSLDAEDADQVLESFAKWLQLNGNTKEVKALASDPIRLVQVLETAFAQEAAVGPMGKEGSGEVFSGLDKNLESLLQNILGKSAGSGTLGQSAPGQSGSDAFGQLSGQAVMNMAASAGTNSAPAQAAPAAMSSMLEQMENIERLTEAMKMANRGAVKNITLQLSPPELGKVTLRVEARDGIVSAFLRVEKPEAVAQLSSNLQQLRENLKVQGIELGELDIRQHNQGQPAGDGGERQRRNQETDPESEAFHSRRGGLAGDEEETDVPEATMRSGGPGNLNLFA